MRRAVAGVGVLGAAAAVVVASCAGRGPADGGATAGTGGAGAGGVAGAVLHQGGAASSLGGRAGASGGGAAGAAAGKRVVVGGDCPVAKLVNPHVDASWVQYSGFGCDVPLLFPGESLAAQPPFEWEPCPPTAGTDAECQQMKPLPGGKVGTGEFSFARSAAGTAILAVVRYEETSYGELAIGHADGPLLLTIASGAKDWSTNLAWFDATTYALSMRDDGVGGAQHGVIAGRFGEPVPTYARRLPNDGETSSNWAVSGDLVVRSLRGIRASPWVLDDGLAVYPSEPKDPDGLPGYIRDVRGSRVFIQVNANGLSGVNTWTKEEGLKPIVRYYGDYERSAMRWSTDGTDMVWVEGEGTPIEPYRHPKMTVMTAPYSTDAATIQATKRALGKDPVEAAPLPLPVGCGFAATAWLNADQTASGLAIVRLSDGVWWKLKPNAFPYAARPLGITCEHVYYSYANQVLRIRLASLPAGGLP